MTRPERKLPLSPVFSAIRKGLTKTQLFALILSLPFMLWKTLSLISNSPMPVTVVTSHSMTPTFERGDILFLWNRDPAIHVGEIPVIWFPGSPLPMVHRAIKVFFDEDNVSSSGYKQRILTKGDGNMADDTLLYPQSQKFVSREEVLGVVRGSLPLLGWVSIVFTQYPWISNLGTGLVVALLLLGYTRRTSLS